MPASSPPTGIGTQRETALHAALKEWCRQPGDQLEVAVEGFVVDILRGELVIEIQTGHMVALKDKLPALLDRHPVRLVYPIAQVRWIVRLAADGETCLSRRRSPKHGTPVDLFRELVYLPELLAHPRFTLHVLLTEEEEIRCEDGQGSWRRRGQSIRGRRLVAVYDQIAIHDPTDLLRFLPDDLPPRFTTRDLAQTLGQPLRLAQRTAYCLRRLELIQAVSRSGRSMLYARRGAR